MAWNILAIKNGWYEISVSVIWDRTCKWTDRPPNDRNIVDIVTL